MVSPRLGLVVEDKLPKLHVHCIIMYVAFMSIAACIDMWYVVYIVLQAISGWYIVHVHVCCKG